MVGRSDGWNDCGWKMINQKPAPRRPAGRPSVRPYVNPPLRPLCAFLTQLAVIFPPLPPPPPPSPPALPPDVVPLQLRFFLSGAADIFCRSKGPFYLNSRIYCSGH